ncbi:MAG: TSUP family transporter, partial [Gemmatimonadota bacterium]
MNELELAVAFLAAGAGSAINSIAGGGTLLTFPAIVALGVPPLIANATSTVALWPGSLGALWGYRKELSGARPW